MDGRKKKKTATKVLTYLVPGAELGLGLLIGLG